MNSEWGEAVAPPEPSGSDTEPGAPIEWQITDFDPDHPFTATLMFSLASDPVLAIPLAPETVQSLGEGLRLVHDAQRAAFQLPPTEPYSDADAAIEPEDEELGWRNAFDRSMIPKVVEIVRNPEKKDQRTKLFIVGGAFGVLVFMSLLSFIL